MLRKELLKGILCVVTLVTVAALAKFSFILSVYGRGMYYSLALRRDPVLASVPICLVLVSNSISIFAVCLYAAGGGSECHIKARA